MRGDNPFHVHCVHYKDTIIFFSVYRIGDSKAIKRVKMDFQNSAATFWQ